MEKIVKPTPTKISSISLVTTIILTCIVIYMESIHKPKTNKEYYFDCYLDGIQTVGNIPRKVLLTCHNVNKYDISPMLQKIISRNDSIMQDVLKSHNISLMNQIFPYNRKQMERNESLT